MTSTFVAVPLRALGLCTAIALASCVFDGPSSPSSKASAVKKTDIADQAPAPIASVLADVGGSYVDDLEKDATGLPDDFAAIVRQFMSLDGFDDAFAPEDIDNVRILPARHPRAGQFITSGHAAITLDTLVIIEDERYDAIMDWSPSWDDVLAGALSPAQDNGLFTMLHELVHVRQFRQRGRERFLSEYLPAALSNGEQTVELEREAYAVAPGEDSWSRRAIAAAY